MSAENFLYEGSTISGIQLRDTLHNKIYEVRSKTVINATGVFADDLILKDNPAHHRIVTPSQGIHLVVDKQYHNTPYAMLIPKTTDGRILFAVPWHDKVVIGTTDTTAPDISEEPQATNEEIHFVLDNFNRYINTQLTSSDIKSVFTGLRPLVKMKNIQSTADLVRDHSIVVSASGLVTITGGKWTTYRKMARDVINMAIRSGNLPFRRCRTRSIKLLLGQKVVGKKASELLHSNYPFTKDDVIYAIHHEMACTLEDILARRIRLLFLDVKVAIEVSPLVCRLLQKELDHDDMWYQSQLESFRSLSKQYLPKS